MINGISRRSLFHVVNNSRADLYYNPHADKLELVYKEEETADAAWIQVPNQAVFVPWLWKKFEASLNDAEKTALDDFFQSYGNLSFLREAGLIDKFTEMATKEAKQVIKNDGKPLNDHTFFDAVHGLI